MIEDVIVELIGTPIVFAAHGWDAAIAVDAILVKLLALNLARERHAEPVLNCSFLARVMSTMSGSSFGFLPGHSNDPCPPQSADSLC